MASSIEFIDYVCDQINGIGEIKYKKMFGEFMVYVNSKPILLICNETVYVKQLDVIKDKMEDADIDYPYSGAKPHYILNIEDADFSKEIVTILEKVTPLPKSRKTSK